MEPKTPTRRSKRGQPAVNAKSTTGASDVSWAGPSIHSRKLNPSTDLKSDDTELLEGRDTDELFTHVHDSIIRTKRTTAIKKVQNRKTQTILEETETFRVGDTILVEGIGKEQNVAVIAGMWEIDLNSDDISPSRRMYVQIHFFVKPNQLGDVRAKREVLKDEIFYTLTERMILEDVGVILRRCAIGAPSRSGLGDDSDDDNDEAPPDHTEFVCRYATNSRRGLYYEFNWLTHKSAAMKLLESEPARCVTGELWDVVVPADIKLKTKPKGKKAQTKAKTVTQRKTSRARFLDNDEEEASDAADSPDEEDYAPELDDEQEDEEHTMHGVFSEEEAEEESASESEIDEPQTPSRKRKRGTAPTTPRKRKKTVAHPTPHSKARSVLLSPRKRQKFTRMPQLTYTADDALCNLPDDPYLKAMHVLHVGSRPDALPCRDAEYQHVLRSVGDLLEEGSGGCVYISGVPGTGKTATVHAVIRELMKMAENNETNPFTYVEINGLRVPEPPAAYIELWQSLSKHDVKKLGRMSISAKESLKALTGYFSKGQGRGPGGHACIVLMDELDQLVTTKQDVVYNFFNWPTLKDSQLIVIAVANTHDLPERVMNGRVRSRLGMTRINFKPYNAKQLAEIVTSRLTSVDMTPGDNGPVIKLGAIKLAAAKVANITGDARRVLDVCRRAVELVRDDERVAAQGEINEVMKAMQNSPIAAYLRDLSFHERVMLASLVKCVKREGVEEIKWGEVYYQHLIYVDALAGSDDPKRKPTIHELGLILESLVSSRAMLVEEGASAAKKPDEDRKVMLNIEQNEVERVLGEVGGEIWKKVLN